MLERLSEHGPLDPYLRLRIAARVMAPWWRRRFHSFGDDSFIHRPAFLFRPWQMDIGARTWIMASAWLEIGSPAFERAEPVLRIGDDVSIRHHFTASEWIGTTHQVNSSAVSHAADVEYARCGLGDVVGIRSAPAKAIAAGL